MKGSRLTDERTLWQARLRARLYKVLEAGHSYDWRVRAFEGAMATLIILNVVVFTLETVPTIQARYQAFFFIFDYASVLIFTIEYIARLWVCTEHPPFRGLRPWRARLKYAFSPLMIVDLLAIAPFYLVFFFSADLRVLRIMRLIRFFKLARFSPAFNTMIRVIAGERSALLGVLIVMFGMIIISASLLYLAEGHLDDSPFSTVPSAMWWSVVTLTTVGYGDVTPITTIGKFIASLVMISGLGFFALPIGIIASAFMEEYQRRDFIVSWGMAARVPVFSHLTPQEVADVLTVLKARTAPAGSLVAVDGERPGALFMVGSGEVDISDEDKPDVKPVRLGEGDFWGARSLLTGAQAETATAVTTCDLIVLDQDDFRRLSKTHPKLHQHLLSNIRDVRDPFEMAMPKSP